MKLSASLSGDFARLMQAEIRGGEVAVTAAMKKAGRGLRDEWRADVGRAGLGPRLPRTIRAEIYPREGNSISTAALVYSRAAKIVDAFERGAVIRSKDGFWLAIPTPAAGRGFRGKRISPGEWERRNGMRLRFVYRPHGPSLLVADNVRVSASGRVRANVTRRRDGTTYSRLQGRATAVIFVLVPQVHLRKRLDLAGAWRRWADRTPQLIVESWPNDDKA